MLDLERGQLGDIRPLYWQTDTSVSNKSWGYIKDDTFKSPEFVVWATGPCNRRNSVDDGSEFAARTPNLAKHRFDLLSGVHMDGVLGAAKNTLLCPRCVPAFSTLEHVPAYFPHSRDL